MTEKLDKDKITKARIAITKTEEAVIAGVEMLRAGQHKSYLIMSLYLPEYPSIRQALYKVCSDVIRYADSHSQLIICQSACPHFNRHMELKRKLGVVAEVYGIKVVFQYDPRLHVFHQDTALLANDALKRRSSIVCEV